MDKKIGKVILLAASHAALHLVISPIDSKDWILSVIYNSCRVQVQCSLWTELAGMASLNTPLILIGDFNAILDFIVSSCYLLDANFISPRYTWCNNQAGQARC